MLDVLGVARDGLAANSRRFDAIANELANVSTPAHKVVRMELDSRHGGGVEARARQQWNPGPLALTGAALDLAVSGEGYFKVRRQDGTVAYTRNGSFSVDSRGRLVTKQGEVVEPGITVPNGATDLRVDREGRVSALVDGERQELGKLELEAFDNPEGLAAAGGGLFEPTANSGAARAATGQIEQGALEGSNTDVAGAMVGLLETRTSYTALARVLRAQDEALGSLVDVLA
jgi:flagellar basal-body rod protein FlgG